jgi:hypothetical protein
VLLSAKFPLGLRFHFNERRIEKNAGVSETEMYGKRLACGSADWHSGVGEGLFLSVFGVN